ncbi:transmembrane protein 98-like [Tubulanus polymorphus]|uniref:transmembrane protein 98-like n=1 Tax=Tubulanus polymorphus TaxID=672921 RepID=UPI003DA5DCAF
MASLDIVVLVAIGLLTAIFVLAMIILIVLIMRQRRRKWDLLLVQQQQYRSDVQLVGADMDSGDLELDDVQIMPQHWEEILQDENWVDDVTGVVPHCIEILKTCHELAEKLVAVTMRRGHYTQPVPLLEIIAIAKRISPRVDDVITAMYPPLEPKLLEARCTALVLSVSHLALVTKDTCHVSGSTEWIDQALLDVEKHLVFLRITAQLPHT